MVEGSKKEFIFKCENSEDTKNWITEISNENAISAAQKNNTRNLIQRDNIFWKVKFRYKKYLEFEDL